MWRPSTALWSGSLTGRGPAAARPPAAATADRSPARELHRE